MPSVHDIARYFLALGRVADDTGDEEDPISNLKLQKLVYYAQGYHLAMFDKALFPEVIEAWGHGPVVRDLYREYKKYGGGPIPKAEDFDINVLGEDTRKFLNEVYAARGQFTAWRLRQMTHAEAPWANSYEPGLNHEITHEKLARYFKTQLVEE